MGIESGFGRYGLVLGRSSPETMGFSHGFSYERWGFSCKVSHPSNENSQVFSGIESMDIIGDSWGISDIFRIRNGLPSQQKIKESKFISILISIIIYIYISIYQCLDLNLETGCQVRPCSVDPVY